MSNFRDNHQQPLSNFGVGNPVQIGAAGEHPQDPVNPRRLPGNGNQNPNPPLRNVVPNPPRGNNLNLNANPPLRNIIFNANLPFVNNIIIPANPPFRNNRFAHFNFVSVQQRRRGNGRRGNGSRLFPLFPVAPQRPGFIHPAFLPRPVPLPPLPALFPPMPIFPLPAPFVFPPVPLPIAAAFIPPPPPPFLPIVPPQRPRQQPFLNLDPDLFPPRRNMESTSSNKPPPSPPPAPPRGMENPSWNRPPPPPAPPRGMENPSWNRPPPPPAPPRGMDNPSWNRPPPPPPPPQNAGFGMGGIGQQQLRTIWTRPPSAAENNDAQRAASPAEEGASLAQAAASFAQRAASPAQGAASPAQRPASPANEVFGLREEPDSSSESSPSDNEDEDNLNLPDIPNVPANLPNPYGPLPPIINHRTGERSFPTMLANFTGSYFVLLAYTVHVEMSVNHCVLLRFGDVSIFVNGDGSIASIIHSNMRLVLNHGKVAGKFTLSSVTDQMLIAGDEGILFTASNLGDAYLVSNEQGISSIPLDRLDFSFDRLQRDITFLFFREFARLGRELFPAVRGIIEAGHCHKRRPWKAYVYVHGVFIRYVNHGEILFRHGARTIHYLRNKGILWLKTPSISITIEYNRQIELKFGNKRVHVSRTGIMVADGARSASMDYFGRLISMT